MMMNHEFTLNIREEVIRNSPETLLNTLCNSELNDTYDGKFYGEVVDTADPLKKGRIRVRVYNLFPDNIQVSDLPWAIPDYSYAGSIKGAFIVPPLTTKVRVYFDNGDIYCPVYEAKGYYQGDLPDGIATNYPDTMILYSTDSGEYFSVNRKTNETKLKLAGTVAIGTSSVELLDLISQTLDALIQSVTPTAIGPQPLSRVLDGTVLTIKTKLDSIKGSI